MRKNWTTNEDSFLRKVVMEKGIDDWTIIAEQMRLSCSDFSRTGKQCRQRWHNHLDPEVNKQAWSYQQSLMLFELHKEVGNRWKEISLKLKGRTDNSIKNHFYSTLRRSLRRLNKVMGEKNATHQIRVIRPSVLTLILKYVYQSTQGNENDAGLIGQLKDLPKLIFEFAEFKPVKGNINAALKEIGQKKIEGIFDLVEQFNKCYLRDKNGNVKIQAQPESFSMEIGHPITHSEFKPQERAVNVLINANKENKESDKFIPKTEAKEEINIKEEDVGLMPYIQEMQANEPSPFTKSDELNANCYLIAGSHWSPKSQQIIEPFENEDNLEEMFEIRENA